MRLSGMQFSSFIVIKISHDYNVAHVELIYSYQTLANSTRFDLKHSIF